MPRLCVCLRRFPVRQHMREFSRVGTEQSLRLRHFLDLTSSVRGNELIPASRAHPEKVVSEELAPERIGTDGLYDVPFAFGTSSGEDYLLC